MTESYTHTCTVGYCFIRVNALIQFLPIEEVLKQLLDLGNASGTSHQHDVMNLSLVHLCVPESLFHRLQGASEQVSVELLKPGSGDGGVEVNSFIQRVDLDAGLSAGGKGALGSFACSAQASDRPLVVTDVLLVLALELRDEVVHHAVVKVFSSQMRVSSSRFDLKDSVFNGQDGNVECSTSQVKDENISLCANLGF